jgi:hypothetical protein
MSGSWMARRTGYGRGGAIVAGASAAWGMGRPLLPLSPPETCHSLPAKSGHSLPFGPPIMKNRKGSRVKLRASCPRSCQFKY